MASGSGSPPGLGLAKRWASLKSRPASDWPPAQEDRWACSRPPPPGKGGDLPRSSREVGTNKGVHGLRGPPGCASRPEYRLIRWRRVKDRPPRRDSRPAAKIAVSEKPDPSIPELAPGLRPDLDRGRAVHAAARAAVLDGGARDRAARRLDRGVDGTARDSPGTGRGRPAQRLSRQPHRAHRRRPAGPGGGVRRPRG